jgi:hypothetical protein
MLIIKIKVKKLKCCVGMFKMSCVLECALCSGRMENIFINNCTLYECTDHCITYSVTAHRENGHARPKYVGATN